MFAKILIANRGEIACRIIKTARSLGIKTVAVYSKADVRALHVAMADEAYLLGSAPVGESYLKGEAILQIAGSAGARHSRIDARRGRLLGLSGFRRCDGVTAR